MGTCSCRRFNPKGPDTPCPLSAGRGVGHAMARGRPFRLLGAWAGPARRQRGQGLPPHVDRRMRCKLLAVGTKSLNTSVRASISSWRGQRAPVPCGGALEARRTSGVPPLSPRAAGGWTWPSPPAGAPSSLTALMSCRNPRRSRLENGAGSRPPEPRGRLSLLGHGQRDRPPAPRHVRGTRRRCQ